MISFSYMSLNKNTFVNSNYFNAFFGYTFIGFAYSIIPVMSSSCITLSVDRKILGIAYGICYSFVNLG